LVDWDRDGEERIIAAALFPASGLPFESLLDVASSLSATERERVFAAAVGERRNRRHRPGRSFEHSSYTFEVVSDYGAFRDLQRHRLLTIEWQELTPALGFEVPDAVEEAGLAPAWKQAVAEAEQVFERMREEMPAQASYLVTLGHRIRYVLKVNAREAMHMIELRTAPQGHPAYRRICREMHSLIDEVAGHHLIARAMSFVGSEDVHLPRYEAESRAEARALQLAGEGSSSST
jgi:hypothetical protein